MSTPTTHIKTEKKLVPALRFNEFEGDFQKKKVGDIAELTSSKRVYLNDYVDVGIPFYRGKEITELRAGKTPDDILYITESSYNEFKSKYGVPQKDDILITAVGTLGNVLRIKNDDKFYFKDGNLIWFRKIKEDSNYLEIALEYYKRAIDKTSIGSTQRALTMIELRKLKFPFPSLPEQQKIASFLSVVDEKIQQLTKKKALLEQYKKGVMQQLFSGQLRFKDENGNPYPDWEEKRLGDLANINMGQSPDSKSYNEDSFGVLLIQGNADINGRITAPRQYTSEPTKTCEIGDLILTVRAPVGSVSKSVHKACIGRGVCSIVNKTNSIQDFLFQFLLSYEDKWGRLEQGSTFTAVSGKDIKTLKLKTPCIEEQQKIATYLSSIDTKIESVNNQIIQTQTFKKGLLQQMFV